MPELRSPSSLRTFDTPPRPGRAGSEGPAGIGTGAALIFRGKAFAGKAAQATGNENRVQAHTLDQAANDSGILPAFRWLHGAMERRLARVAERGVP